MPGKREDYLSWEEFFMGSAILASCRSKDPNNQVGACIVNDDKKILSVGYNGLPKNMDDDTFDWKSTGEQTGIIENIKDNYVVHAERNAILNFRGNMKELEGSTVYVTWFPCNECAKEIAQVGIKKVVYLRMYSKKDKVNISMKIFKDANVEIVPYNNEKEIDKEQELNARKEFQKILKRF